MAIRQLPVGRLTARLPGGLLDGCVPLAFGLALILLTPWPTALQFGQDEGFELMKAWLVSRGHPLYGAFWNDQPPLHTEILALLFRLFGPSAGMGRLLSLGFAMLLVAALHHLVRRNANRTAGWVAVLLLTSSSGFVELSLSTMLELPAFALGLASVWSWTRWEDVRARKWLVLSGVLLALALQVKLTAALWLPGLLAVWLMAENPSPTSCRDALGTGTARGKHGAGLRFACDWRAVTWWAGSASAAFSLIALLFDRAGMWSVIHRSHFSSGTSAGAVKWEAVFHPATLESDLGMLAPAAMGLVVWIWQRRRALLFPALALVTALLVHLHHRPYWSYYRIHFSIPLAWLGAVGLVEGWRLLWAGFPTRSPWAWPGLSAGCLAWSLAAATAVALTPEKTWWEIQRLRQAPLARDDQRVQALRAHADGGDWIFTEDRIRAFWARLPIPPELAVIPAKRLWSGQLPPEQVRACLDRYEPALIFLSETSIVRFRLVDYLAWHYSAVPGVPGLFARR